MRFLVSNLTIPEFSDLAATLCFFGDVCAEVRRDKIYLKVN